MNFANRYHGDMYRYDGEDIFILDSHVHLWDASEENIIHDGGEQFIQCFYDYHAAFTPEEHQWDLETYRKYGPEKMLDDLFGAGPTDMAIFQSTYLSEFYEEGFNTTEQNAELAEEYPERFILNGTFDPRDGEEGMEYLESLDEQYDLQGVKLYTAEWRGDSKGWRLDSDESFEFLQKCADLGITNIHPHKGPTIRPLNRDAFDVADVDDAATSFPELNFIVEHVGYPRLDDFCHIAAQETNVYGGLAVAAPFAQNRPRKFGNMLGELLFWLGEDNLLFGSDYAIWEPSWLVPAVMEAEMTPDQRDEFGVELTTEMKKKIMGENAARLYDVDIEAKKREFQDDEISQRYDLGDSYAGAAADD
jgi:predicted TIM-barrel fold metal-dependent hydrolase